MTKITVIGGGAWGTTQAKIAAENGHEVRLWVYEKELKDNINKNNENNLYLPGIELPKNITAFNSFKDALKDTEIIINAVPSKFVRMTAKKYSEFVPENCIIISVTKGMEEHTFKTMTQVLEEEINKNNKFVALSGPNHAEEVSRKIPSGTVIASKDKECLKFIKKTMDNDYFKVFILDDIIGVQICGAMKNIVAIAAGACDGLGLGDNAKASIITLGLTEMNRFGRKFGAKQKTCFGLAGVGDLVATCTSKHSRNRFVGEMMGKGLNFEEIKTEMHGQVAEGAEAVKAVYEYSKENKINMPITKQAYKILYESKEIKKAVKDLVDFI